MLASGTTPGWAWVVVEAAEVRAFFVNPLVTGVAFESCVGDIGPADGAGVFGVAVLGCAEWSSGELYCRLRRGAEVGS